ncbi:MAG: Hsp20/alpha crystallin family protein [Candidatus Nomurabacteria bacterium]|nr:MAG: Hsp20/alpha crystallin family protein [Candidatus Nomurabacteria bacterium]
MPKKLVVTTKTVEVQTPPPSAVDEELFDEEFGDDDEQSSTDPMFNPETGKIEQVNGDATFFQDIGAGRQSEDDNGAWLNDEYTGQLAVDVYQTEQDIVIKAAIAGVQSDDVDIQVTNDMVTIKGARRLEDEVTDDQYFYRECYWGRFSRTIILPVDVRSDKVSATIKNGILSVRLPKSEPSKVTVVSVNDEDTEG